MSARGYFSLMLLFGAMASVSVFLALIFTSPAKVGPFGVTVWFGLLWAGLAGLTAAGLFWYKLRSPRIQNTEDRLLSNSWRQGCLAAGTLVAILALSSLRQLTWRDTGIILGIAVLLEIFLRSRQ